MAHLTPATPTPHGVGDAPGQPQHTRGRCPATRQDTGQVDANVHALSYPHRTRSSSSKEAKNEHPP